MAEAQATHSTVFDSGQQYLGGVYAKALLGASEKAGTTDRVLAEFDSLVHDVLAKLPKLEALLCSPRIPHEVKERLLDKTFGGKMAPALLTFLKVVSRHVRFDCIRAIHRAAWHQFNEIRGRVVVYVRTAEALPPDLSQLIAAKLKGSLGKEVELRATVDPEVLGGLIVRIGDTVYDGSLANQLVRLKDETLRKTAQEIRHSVARFTTA